MIYVQEIAGRTYSEMKHHLEKGKTSLKHPVKFTDKNQPRDLRTAAQTALWLGRTSLPRNFSPRGHQQGKTALPLMLYSYDCWALLNRAHSAQEKQHSTSKQQHGQKIFDTTDWKKWNNYPQRTEITDVCKPQGHGFLISRTATTQKLTAAAHQKWLGESKQETNTEFHRAILMHQGTDTREVKQTEIVHFRQSPWSRSAGPGKRECGWAETFLTGGGQQQTKASCSRVFITGNASPAPSWTIEIKNVFGANKTPE